MLQLSMQTNKELLALPTMPFGSDYGWWPALYLVSTGIRTDHPGFRRVAVVGAGREESGRYALVGKAILSYAEEAILPLGVADRSGDSALGIDAPRAGLFRLYASQYDFSIELAVSTTRIIARKRA